MSGTLFMGGITVATPPVHDPSWQPENVLLSTTGNGTGSSDGAVDGSVTPVELFVDSNVGATTFDVRQLFVTIADNGTLDAGRYGNNLTLVNGIVVEHRTSADALIRTLTASPVLQNTDWSTYAAGDLQLATFGTGENVLTARVRFDSFREQGLMLQSGDKLVVVLADDLTNLQGHEFLARGYAD